MKSTFDFLAGMIVGAVIGAAAALLFAPQSGEELRANIQERAALERQRLQERYEKQVSQLQAQLDTVRKDIQSMRDEAKKPAQSEGAVSEGN